MKARFFISLLALGMASYIKGAVVPILPTDFNDGSRIETFTFESDGPATKAHIYLPESYGENKNLPTIYLIDFTEQHFKMARDEFAQVIAAVRKFNKEALVITLNEILDIDAEPQSFEIHFQMYRDLVSAVDAKYSTDSSRTLIGKGSESGLVMMALFTETPETSLFDNFIATDPSGHYATAILNQIENENIASPKSNKKLHFSFTSSNDYPKCSKIIGSIEEAAFPWLEFKSEKYRDRTYENAYPHAYAEAIEVVFESE